METVVTIKCVYGKELIYPVCDKSKLLADLSSTRTFTRRNIDVIKQLGYQITVRSLDFVL